MAEKSALPLKTYHPLASEFTNCLKQGSLQVWFKLGMRVVVI